MHTCIHHARTHTYTHIHNEPFLSSFCHRIRAATQPIESLRAHARQAEFALAECQTKAARALEIAKEERERALETAGDELKIAREEWERALKIAGGELKIVKEELRIAAGGRDVAAAAALKSAKEERERAVAAVTREHAFALQVRL